MEAGVERALQRVAAVKGEFVPLLPEVALLRVRVDATGKQDLVYSLVYNDAHSNVAFLFGEDKRRLPADDTLSVVRGHFGSYPNFIFEVEVGKVSEFVEAMLAMRSDADLERFVGSHGIRRTSARFWETTDWCTRIYGAAILPGRGSTTSTTTRTSSSIAPLRRRELLEHAGHGSAHASQALLAAQADEDLART